MSTLPSAIRRIGPRLIRLGEQCEDAAAEAAQLRELFVSSPGVEAVREICPHLKGGYVALLDVSMTKFDDLFAYLGGKGWREVW